jgi:predicted CXXCH cytochrome family protein
MTPPPVSVPRAHNTSVPDQPRSRIVQTCRNCHSAIFDDYAVSVHGVALLTEENPDVPTCIECHGVHNINAPTTALFRNRSPELCASCHADREMMTHYDVSIDVFETYVDDFHGTTVNIFQSNDPNTPTNKAVFYDFHGVHAIMAVDDPNSGIKENLLVTCSSAIPTPRPAGDSWTGHLPSLRQPADVPGDHLTLSSSVYRRFFGFLVATDIYRKHAVGRRMRDA